MRLSRACWQRSDDIDDNSVDINLDNSFDNNVDKRGLRDVRLLRRADGDGDLGPAAACIDGDDDGGDDDDDYYDAFAVDNRQRLG